MTKIPIAREEFIARLAEGGESKDMFVPPANILNYTYYRVEEDGQVVSLGWEFHVGKN